MAKTAKLTIEIQKRDGEWLYEISSPQVAELLDDGGLLTRGTTPDLQDIVDIVAYDIEGVVYMVFEEKDNENGICFD